MTYDTENWFEKRRFEKKCISKLQFQSYYCNFTMNNYEISVCYREKILYFLTKKIKIFFSLDLKPQIYQKKH